MENNDGFVSLSNDIDTFPFSIGVNTTQNPDGKVKMGMTGSPTITSLGNFVYGNADVNFATKGDYVTVTITGAGLQSTIIIGDGTFETFTYTSTDTIAAKTTALSTAINDLTNFVVTNINTGTGTFDVYSPRFFRMIASGTNATFVNVTNDKAIGQYIIQIGDYIFAKGANGAAKDTIRRIVGLDTISPEVKRIVIDRPFDADITPAIALRITPASDYRQFSIANVGNVNGKLNNTPLLVSENVSFGIENNLRATSIGYADPVVLDAATIAGGLFHISYFK